MRRWVGKTLVLIGILHSLFGLVFMGPVLKELASDGLVNTVNGQPEREAVFWFLYTGFALILLGAVVDWIEARHAVVPLFLAWALLASTLVALVVMPASGFWLLLVPVAGMFTHRKSSQAKPEAA